MDSVKKIRGDHSESVPYLSGYSFCLPHCRLLKVSVKLGEVQPDPDFTFTDPFYLMGL